ncbi:MAG: hypothetical protein NC389_17195 [Acetatifactor muris]|nr:hypothetical protein [Acetatifactor muris]
MAEKKWRTYIADRNGREIYEDDRVRISGGIDYSGRVIYDTTDAAFVVSPDNEMEDGYQLGYLAKNYCVEVIA